jgi:hypothetical protein
VDALVFNSTGSNNTATGLNALFSNTTGNNNTAIGSDTLSSNITGDFNVAVGPAALLDSTTGNFNIAIGVNALANNLAGSSNIAIGPSALFFNETGSQNTAIGAVASVAFGNLNNVTVIGAGASANVSNKVRLGNTAVTVIEGQVPFTASSDKTKKENFKPVDGEDVLRKIRGFELTSWNFIGHDPKEFRHYGPMAQDFYAAFGHDSVGQIGTDTTINSGDIAGILMIAVQALEKRTAQISALESELKQKDAQIAALAARLEALEARQNPSIQVVREVSQGVAVEFARQQ